MGNRVVETRKSLIHLEERANSTKMQLNKGEDDHHGSQSG